MPKDLEVLLRTTYLGTIMMLVSKIRMSIYIYSKHIAKPPILCVRSEPSANGSASVTGDRGHCSSSLHYQDLWCQRGRQRYGQSVGSPGRKTASTAEQHDHGENYNIHNPIISFMMKWYNKCTKFDLVLGRQIQRESVNEGQALDHPFRSEKVK